MQKRTLLSKLAYNRKLLFVDDANIKNKILQTAAQLMRLLRLRNGHAPRFWQKQQPLRCLGIVQSEMAESLGLTFLVPFDSHKPFEMLRRSVTPSVFTCMPSLSTADSGRESNLKVQGMGVAAQAGF